MNLQSLLSAAGLILLGVLSNNSTATAQTVCTEGALANAIENSQPGDDIVMCNGTWEDLQLIFLVDGEEGAPITLRPETPGRVKLVGNTRISMAGQYAVIDGLIFTGTYTGQDRDGLAVPLVEFKSGNTDCSYCRLTNSAFLEPNPPDPATHTRWVTVHGQYNRVDHSFFRGKTNNGAMLDVQVLDPNPDYHRIDHNYFGERPPEAPPGDGSGTLAVGTRGKTAHFESFTQVDHNYFYKIEPYFKIIMNKSSSNYYYDNVFDSSPGTLNIRHGDNVWIERNFFFGNNIPRTGGVRLVGSGHTVINNYFQDISSGGAPHRGGIVLEAAHANPGPNDYQHVRDVLIAFNTCVNSDNCLRFGVGTVKEVAPANITIANNLISTTTDEPIKEDMPLVDSEYLGNIVHGHSMQLARPGIEYLDPQLVETDGLFRPAATSPVIGAAQASAAVSSVANVDMDLEPRALPYDVGADELDAGSRGTGGPIHACDTGPTTYYIDDIWQCDPVDEIPRAPTQIIVSIN